MLKTTKIRYFFLTSANYNISNNCIITRKRSNLDLNIIIEDEMSFPILSKKFKCIVVGKIFELQNKWINHYGENKKKLKFDNSS